MRNRLFRSPAYWILVVLSVGALVYGIVLSVPRIGSMEAGLLDQSATTADVYGGQAWVTLAAGLVAAGASGVFLALALAAATRLVPQGRLVAEPVEGPATGIDWDAVSDEFDEPADEQTEEPTDDAEDATEQDESTKDESVDAEQDESEPAITR
ncbi:MAG: hypothetical protein QM607_03955 [Microbacterium sp.]